MNPENIASLLEDLAQQIPNREALILPRQHGLQKVSFKHLNREVGRLAYGLGRFGVLSGDRILLMVPYGIEFVALTFALFRAGAVPVLIDPGLDRKQVLTSIANVNPHGMIGIPRAHIARLMYKRYFKNATKFVTVGPRLFWGGKTLNQIRSLGEHGGILPETQPNDTAAILFTSGSTGPPKGVVYTHRMFTHQIQLIKKMFDIEIGDIDMPTFPLFGLFGVGMGMTCILPDMNPAHPASVNPDNIIEPIKKYSVASSFGSPALWNTVTKYCLDHDIQLPSLKRILMAGAPVPGTLLERFNKILSPDAEVHTPYGATEALPVATISKKEILGETWAKTQQGWGTCVGMPIEGIEVKIIRITDEPIKHWDPTLLVEPGVIGEVVVKGPWVTQAYYGLNEENLKAKIEDGDTLWHRMGDLGYLDEQGRLWFCGRKSHRVLTQEGYLFTLLCEPVFNQHDEIKRSALVGVGPQGNKKPVLIVELNDYKKFGKTEERKRLIRELLKLGAGNENTRAIKTILFHPGFPVDIRHNAKIKREELAEWATGLLKK